MMIMTTGPHLMINIRVKIPSSVTDRYEFCVGFGSALEGSDLGCV